jgi:hypothetical protein
MKSCSGNNPTIPESQDSREQNQAETWECNRAHERICKVQFVGLSLPRQGYCV